LGRQLSEINGASSNFAKLVPVADEFIVAAINKFYVIQAKVNEPARVAAYKAAKAAADAVFEQARGKFILATKLAQDAGITLEGGAI
jgi:hypothetical protein